MSDSMSDGAVLAVFSAAAASESPGARQRGSSNCAKSTKARRWPAAPRPAKWKTIDTSIGVKSE